MVGQVREAVGALGVGTVADGAVGGEQAGTHFQCLLVLGHFGNRHGGELGVQRTVLLVRAGHFLLPLVDAGPAFLVTRQDAFPVAQARVQDQVADREDHGADEQHEPPLGQRVVILLDAVEGVTHRLVGGVRTLALAGREQQPGQRHYGA